MFATWTLGVFDVASGSCQLRCSERENFVPSLARDPTGLKSAYTVLIDCDAEEVSMSNSLGDPRALRETSSSRDGKRSVK